MTIRILYVEDDTDISKDVKCEVEAGNRSKGTELIRNWRPMIVDIVPSPEDVATALRDHDYDLILADVFFPRQKTKRRAAGKIDRLNEVIVAAEQWRATNKLERALPIIAYTAFGKEALESLLSRREKLYDIWDKAAASSAYVAWRLNRITLELFRSNPDVLMGRLIRRMPADAAATWHKHVSEMTRRYANGWTERDQIKSVQEPINVIASEIDGTDTLDNCWNTMTKWEPLSRAISPRVRGHARHVMHVFWLGYYLLHQSPLSGWFSDAWRTVVAKRGDMDPVLNDPPLQALSNAWFYAALCHDVAGCVQEFAYVGSKIREVLKPFVGLVTEKSGTLVASKELKKRATSLFDALAGEQSLHDALLPLWEKSISDGRSHPDHGVVAAAFLTAELSAGAAAGCYAREAARAMMIHNLLGKLDTDPGPLLSWHSEPLACLLVLCDQLQTWDRERKDEAKDDEPTIRHAEFSELEVSATDGRAMVALSIDYFAPPHLDHAPVLFDTFKDKLQGILRNNPLRALKRVSNWPFKFEAKCSLNGVPLDVPMRFS